MQQNELPEGKSIRRNCSMDELQQEQFTKALLGLVDLAKTKKNVLQYGEINDAFKGLELTEDKMDLVCFISCFRIDHWNFTKIDNGC